MKSASFVPPWDDPRSPWRTAKECALYLRMFAPSGEPDIRGAREFLDARVAEPRQSCRRGRVVLYRREFVESVDVLTPRQVA